METMVKNEMKYRDTKIMGDYVRRIIKSREQRGLDKILSTYTQEKINKRNLQKRAEKERPNDQIQIEEERKGELVEVGTTRRRAVSFTQNRVQPSGSTCHVCKTMDAINYCVICKHIMCVRDTVYCNKIQFCKVCNYNPENEQCIRAMVMNHKKTHCLKKLTPSLIYILSFEWLRKNKKK